MSKIVFLGFFFSESTFEGFLLMVKYFLGCLEIPNSTDSCLQVCQVHPWADGYDKLF